MRGSELLDKLEFIDADLIEAASMAPKRKRHPWLPWCAAAACLGLILTGAAAGIFRQNAPDSSTIQSTQSGTDISAFVPTTESDPTDGSVPTVPTADWEIHYNQVTQSETCSTDAARKNDFYIFGEALTPDEMDLLAPDSLADQMEITGSALYYGFGTLHGIQLEALDPVRGDCVSIFVRDAEHELHTCPVVSEETPAVETVLGSLSFAAYQYTDALLGYTLLWAEFERGGICYSVSVEAAIADGESAKASLYDVMASYAQTETVPDLSLFTPKGDYEFIDETMTLEEAQNDVTFGAWMLREVPAGFGEESFRRFKNPDFDYLYGFWAHGYEYLSWEISWLSEADGARITSVEEKENYDLSLYPIPRAESVPEELQQIVDNPIFRIEELTRETVWARAYTTNDSGDTNGYRMSFSVLYGDVVVHVSSKGVSPDWVCEQLMKLK